MSDELVIAGRRVSLAACCRTGKYRSRRKWRARTWLRCGHVTVAVRRVN